VAVIQWCGHTRNTFFVLFCLHIHDSSENYEGNGYGHNLDLLIMWH
jgi:hypothetical protein